MRVAVIGAGIVGCASALALARRGVEVTLLERARFGSEAASSAAAGILGAQLERFDDGGLWRLCLASRERYADWLGALGAEDVGYRRCGAMRVAFDDAEREALAAQVDEQHTAGLSAALLDRDQARGVEPALSPDIRGAAFFDGDAVIDPPKLLRAALEAARRAGAVLRSGAHVERLIVSDLRVVGVALEGGERVEVDVVVDAAGSWASLIGAVDAVGVVPDAVRPARGQMLELGSQTAPLSCVLEGPDAYLSPRRDGRVLVGSTVEEAGFERAVTAAAVERLLAGAIRLVPSLADAHLRDSWCGFRARTRDGLPVLDRPAPGFVIASGHFRNGIVLAPLTAAIVEALVLDEAPPVDVSPYGVARLAHPC